LKAAVLTTSSARLVHASSASSTFAMSLRQTSIIITKD